MADKKHILVIDDQFDLGSDLEKILQNEADPFDIRSVPSGEEAMLELSGRLDLVITKLRLPGMEGHEFAKRAYRRYPELPFILITDDTLDRAKKTIGDVAVFRILRTPLMQEEVYKAIQEAIYGEVVSAPSSAPAIPDIKELPPIRLSAEVEKRLDILRTDTGSLRLVLGAMDGRIAFTTQGSLGLNIDDLVPIIARNLRGSAELASVMESDDPFSLHYQTSKRFETYIASIGQDFFVALFFDVRARRSRFGMIWTALQRGVGDLKNKMPILDIKPIESTANVAAAAVAKKTATIEAKPSAPEPAAIDAPEEEPAIKPNWTPPASAANLEGGQSMSFEEAMKQGLLGGSIADNPLFARDESDDDALDLFGDVSDSGGEGLFDDLAAEPAAPSMSFEEAMKQGLLAGAAADNPIFAQDESEDDALDLFGDVSDDTADGGDDFAALFAEAGNADSEQEASEDGMSFADAMSQGLVGGGIASTADDDEPFELDLGDPDDEDLEDDLAALEALAALGGNAQKEEPSSEDTSAEEDAFWNAMVSGNTSKSTVDGKSFEEAMQEGLAANDSVDKDPSGADSDFLAALEGDGDDANMDDLWSEESINKALSETVPGLSLDEAREQGLFDADKKKK